MQSTVYAYPGSSANVIDLGSSASSGPPSSSPHYYRSATSVHKRRRIYRACDACRRRKTKCDGPKMPDNVCTNCLQTKKSCTYIESSKPRGPPKAYITGLEDRMEKLEALLHELRPEIDFSSELGPPVIRDSWKLQDLTPYRPSSGPPSVQLSPSVLLSASMATFSPQSAPVERTSHLIFDPHPTTRRTRSKAEQPFHGEDTDNESAASDDSAASGTLGIETITGIMKKLTLRGTDSNMAELIEHDRFHGDSSAVGVVEATLQFKSMYLLGVTEDSRPPLPSAPQPSAGDLPLGSFHMRPEFWHAHQWEYDWELGRFNSTDLFSSALAEFPPTDLAEELIRLYFTHVNSFLPLLHHPTFHRQWRDKLYHKNVWFATLCLFLFALASRWTDDPRVIKGGPSTAPNVGAWGLGGFQKGAMYFEKGAEIHLIRRSVFYPAPLLEVQSLALLALYLSGTENYPSAWLVVGVAFRKAQDVGAHRKNVYRSKPTIDDEFWKRTFWCLIVLDRLSSTATGRGCAIGEEDFDLDLPLEVDDQYWETDDPAPVVQQPAGIPSRVCAFTSLIKLSQVIAFALRTVYAIDGAKIFSGLNYVNWRTEVFEQLNAALSEWAASVPVHLMWPPLSEHLLFTAQAGVLQALYHLFRMIIYRPFISFSSTGASHLAFEKEPSSFPYPAMEICVEAARSCARIAEVLMQRRLLNNPILMHAVHISASVLLARVWDLKAQEKGLQALGIDDFKPPFAQRIEPFLADVNMFIRILEWAELRWSFVSPFLHQLRESLPDFGKQSPLSTTEDSIYGAVPSPTVPPQSPVQFPLPDGEIPLNGFWQSDPIAIQPARSGRSERPRSQHLHPHHHYNPDLPTVVNHKHSPLSRSVEELYETREGSYSLESASWPPSHHSVDTFEVPNSSASTGRSNAYISNTTRGETFVEYQRGGDQDDDGKGSTYLPHPHISGQGPTSSQFRTAFDVRADMTIGWDNQQCSGHGYE